MALLIDGYNLLHASGVTPPETASPTFEAARRALLDDLQQHLPPQLLSRTTVVFDAQSAPRGIPDRFQYAGMHIRFARGYVDADALIVELIGADSAPRRLTVVSSDHQVQRAARRRRAAAVDSDQWIRQLHQGDPSAHGKQRPDRGKRRNSSESRQKPEPPQNEEEVQQWLDWFNLPDEST